MFIGILISVISTSCSNEELELSLQDDYEEKVWHKGFLTFNTEYVTSRSDQGKMLEPSNGDLLLLTFKQGYTYVRGYAKYNSASKVWELSYLGNLESCSNLSCEGKYIGNNPVLSSDLTFVDVINCPIFEINNGVYSFNGIDNITLSASLAPKYPRFRFKGNEEKTFQFRGVRVADSFGLGDNNGWTWYTFWPYRIDGAISLQENGYYSPYYYGFASYYHGNEVIMFVCNNIWIKDGETVYLWKKDITNYLKDGTSGTISLPDISPNEWYSDNYNELIVPDIIIASKTNGHWTQTQSQTRFYSNVGIQFVLEYIISSYDGPEGAVDYPFVISVSGYDKNGTKVGSSDYEFNNYDLEENDTMSFDCGKFIEGAAYYEIQFYEHQLSAKITNFKISTF